MAWEKESRRHSLARKGIKTNIGQHRKLGHRDSFRSGGKKKIYSQFYEGLDGTYYIEIYEDWSYRMETPDGIDDGHFDKDGYCPRAKWQERDIESWLDNLGQQLVKGELD